MPATWSELKASDPALAQAGEERFHGRMAYLATVRKDGSPRVFPVGPFTDGAHLWLFVSRTSPKRFDLLNDGRYSLHCEVEDNQGGNGEFHITGRAVQVVNDTARSAASAAWPGSDPVEDSYLLFELLVSSAVHTVYRAKNAIRTSWTDDEVRS